MLSTKEKFEKVFDEIHRENKTRIRAGTYSYFVWLRYKDTARRYKINTDVMTSYATNPSTGITKYIKTP